MDILSGSYSYKGGESAGIYILEYSKEKKTYKQDKKILTSDGKTLNPGKGGRNGRRGNCLSPFASDWDSDGDLDMLVGSMQGEISIAINEGTSKEYKFEKMEPLKDTKGKIIGVPSFMESNLQLADWDNDGDQDLMIGGGFGGIYWCENVQKKNDKTPVLNPIKELVPPSVKRIGNKRHYGAPFKTGCAQIYVCDFNEDGLFDMIVGDQNGYVWLLIRKNN